MNDTRVKILKTAEKLLSESGLSGAGLNPLIERSGAPRGSLYYHFPDGKEQWVKEALQQHSDQFLAFCHQMLEGAPSVGAGIEQVFIWVGARLKKQQFNGGCPVGAVIMDLNTESEQYRAQIQNLVAQWKSALLVYLQEPLGQNAADVAGIVIASFEGALMMSRLERSEQAMLKAGHYMARWVNFEIAAVQ